MLIETLQVHFLHNYTVTAFVIIIVVINNIIDIIDIRIIRLYLNGNLLKHCVYISANLQARIEVTFFIGMTFC